MATGTNKYPGDSLQKLQETEREILAVFDSFCRNHELTYFIDSGTCLGAVRHGGFIPWDDDIDVGMPYEDYLRFLQLAESSLPQGYAVYTPQNNPAQAIFSAKMIKKGTFFSTGELEKGNEFEGIFIDVFPYFRLDSNPSVARKQARTSRYWQSMSYLRHVRHVRLPQNAPLKPLLQLACSIVHRTIAQLWTTPQMFAKVMRALEAGDQAGEWTSICYTAYGAHADEVLFPVREIAFDDLTVFAPNDCHAYLKSHFGDYMKLPPEDRRFTHAPVILDFGDGVNVIEQ